MKMCLIFCVLAALPLMAFTEEQALEESGESGTVMGCSPVR